MTREPKKPTQLITREFAKKLHLNYAKTRTPIIRRIIKKEDANAIWFSLEELENYIHYIKIEGKKDGYDVNGIRFYFGVYPEEEKYQEKAGLTTLFLNATGKKIKLHTNTPEVHTLALRVEESTSDIESIEPMNYGNMGRPPSLTYL
jgi:hypothetical protein